MKFGEGNNEIFNFFDYKKTALKHHQQQHRRPPQLSSNELFFRNQQEDIESFHRILAPVIFVGNIFSIFPVCGIFKRYSDSLRFLIYYPVAIYAIITSCCLFTEIGLLLFLLSKTGFKMFIIGQTIFTSVCTFTVTYFFYLSIKWPQIMSTWHEHEKIFLTAPYANKIKIRTHWKIQLSAFMIISFSILDHYIYFISAVERTEDHIVKCPDDKQDFWRHLYVSERQAFFQVLTYSKYEIPFLELYEVIKTVAWTYSEVFVIVASWTLSMRFRQLNNRLKLFVGRDGDFKFWTGIREHYNILSNLVLYADKFLSPFFIVYCFCNSYFICQKILIQFENKQTWERYYSSYSTFFLILRTIAFLYAGSSVNEESKETLKILRAVTNKSFSILNYRRLVDVLRVDSVGLSGYRFFHISRGVILTIAGTILTYELVLVQQIKEIQATNDIITYQCGEILI